MSSPNCTVNGLTPPQNVSASATVTIALIDTAVDSWTILCTSTDELNLVATVNASLSVNQIAKTATYTQPSTASGSALQWTSTVVTGGITSSTTFKVAVLDPMGQELFFPGESFEGNSSFGVVAGLNGHFRSTVSIPNATSTTPGAIQLTKDLGGTYNSPLVVGIQGNPVKAVTLGAAQDGYIPVWVNANSDIEFKSVASIAVDAATTTSLGTVQLAGDLGGSGTVATAPTVGSLTGNASNVVSVAGTTPSIQSNSSATSFTVGTNKTGSSLKLQGDLGITGITLSGSQNGIVGFSGAIDGYQQAISTTLDYIVDGYGVNDFIILAKYSATHTIHLPAPTAGRWLIIKDAGFNLTAPSVVMNIAQHASEKIENIASTYVVSAPGAKIQLVSNGTDWFVIN